MRRSRLLLPATFAILLAVLAPLATAHGDEHEGEGEMAMNMTLLSPSASGVPPNTYFMLEEHKTLIYLHISLMILSWVVLLPVGIMLSLARSRFTLPTQVTFLLANAFGLVTGLFYNHSTPDLYPNNSHHKGGWAFVWIATSWVILGLVNLYSQSFSDTHQPISTAAMARYERLQVNDEREQPTRWSNDSGQGTERNSASLFGDQSRSPSVGSENQAFTDTPPYQNNEFEDVDVHGEEPEKRGFLRNSRVDRFLAQHVPKFAFGRTLIGLRVLHAMIERFLLPLGFVAILTGLVVYGGIARGNDVFSVLAHFVKGGIFFWYGLFALGRWGGAFADLGWAWNVKPTSEMVGLRAAASPTAEFVESFLIFVYGISNVWLEHLAAWGAEWTAQDLEHVSITIMFFGGGVLGMLIESHRIRDFLSTNILRTSSSSSPTDTINASWTSPKTYSTPMNPLPGLIILLLGLMMSGHHQHSQVSTTIHAQWGSLFIGAALARAITYILLYLAPPASYLPGRPPSELITSFCLVSGGLIFMQSNKDTVEAMERRGLDAMFSFTVCMGVTCLVMAWTVGVVAIKGWAQRNEEEKAAKKGSGDV